MSFGGFLGMGESYHPLPWKVLTYDTRQGGYVVDLDRSRLLHRLRLLRVAWGRTEAVRGKGTFKEAWKLRWEPELEVALIEKAPWGNSIVAAASGFAIDRATRSDTLPELTALVEVVLLAELPDAIERVMHQLENQAALTSEPLHALQHVCFLGTAMVFWWSVLSREAQAASGLQHLDETIRVLSGGPATTVQDYPGRLGYWDVGIPPSGPIDDLGFRLANRVVGNVLWTQEPQRVRRRAKLPVFLVVEDDQL